MAKRKRDVSAFSMSFLDCICCGFGAIILLFVLSKSGEPVVIEQVNEDLSAVLAKQEKELFEIRGETAMLNRDLEGKVEQLSVAKEKLARLQGDLSDIKGAFLGSASDATVQNKIEGTLAEARQDLTEEMKRLLANIPKNKRTDSVGGIPVDSEYIVFIIDTSGSMKGNAWPMVMRKMRETLDLYPQEGHPGDERHGELYVQPVPGYLDPGHARPAECDFKDPGHLGGVQQQQSGRGNQRRDPRLLRQRQEDQPVYLWG
jgi:hypothetical protein